MRKDLTPQKINLKIIW